MSFASNLSISKLAVSTGLLTPSPIISPLALSGEKYAAPGLASLQSDGIFVQLQYLVIQIVTSAVSAARRLGTVG